ncbi:hypothetical protein FRC18_010564 [Serendipita sp. 400]|nr:hypothetical protein FRC18_010564 [Serendipita sp. 400]
MSTDETVRGIIAECDLLKTVLAQIIVLERIEENLSPLQKFKSQMRYRPILGSCSVTLHALLLEVERFNPTSLPKPKSRSGITWSMGSMFNYLFDENRLSMSLGHLKGQRRALQLVLPKLPKQSLKTMDNPQEQNEPFIDQTYVGAFAGQELVNIGPHHQQPLEPLHPVDGPERSPTDGTFDQPIEEPTQSSLRVGLLNQSVHDYAAVQLSTISPMRSSPVLNSGLSPILSTSEEPQRNELEDGIVDTRDEDSESVQEDILDLTGEVGLTQSRPVYDGPYSTVYKGQWNAQEVAVKIIRTAGALSKTRRKIRRESQTWAKLRHPNVLLLYGLCLDDWCGEYGALISSWCSHGRASEYLPQILDEPAERIRLLSGVAQGVHYLHSLQPIIVHGDLKPANILIDSDRTAKLCDFGLVRLIREEVNTGMTTTSAHTGTARYLSKELVVAEHPMPTPASDCYAFGCVALEFAYLQRPYAHRTTTYNIY